MSEAKNTPGPWTSSLMNQHSEYPPIILISGGDGNIVCEISDICVNDADLSFMLAAPDMYEALECACDKYCIGYAGDSLVKCEDCVIHKALRKARGVGMSEPVSNPYKLHTCENCHHSIWDKEGCYCNRVIADMHKVNENDMCDKWEEEVEE